MAANIPAYVCKPPSPCPRGQAISRNGQHSSRLSPAIDSHDYHFHLHEAEKGRDKGVPMRSRQLPASFFREPNVPKMGHLPVCDPRGVCGLGYCTQCHVMNAKNAGLFNPLFINRTLSEIRPPYHLDLYQGFPGKLSPEQEIYANQARGYAYIPAPDAHGVAALTLSSISSNAGQQDFRANLPPVSGYPPMSEAQQSQASRRSIWRPIPFKTVSSYPSRYHPFGDVR